ncbi:hypothetical protein QE109_06550 [Fusibacter bizertensis]|jgi:hypothetical protein|uniref:XRE family transcriptional regulator n=1 Tax=Fusibacter bizertensis TaxID=1488331 RepID=A0ABT6NBM0_9FIRM|nr:hypothetical protein [Fusibacter bizertensis]MDH8677799.1 hypothetical protein [Fusibacter bizertensis]
MDKKKPSTEILAESLIKSSDIDAFLDTHSHSVVAENFNDYLYHLVEVRDMKISDCLRLSMISESYGYQLFNGKRQPSRTKVLQLALGLGLALDETNRLLKLAEKSELYVKDQRDAVVMFALNKNWSLFDTEALLNERGLPSIVKAKD